MEDKVVILVGSAMFR